MAVPLGLPSTSYKASVFDPTHIFATPPSLAELFALADELDGMPVPVPASTRSTPPRQPGPSPPSVKRRRTKKRESRSRPDHPLREQLARSGIRGLAVIDLTQEDDDESPLSESVPSQGPSEDCSCPICFEDLPKILSSERASLECGHVFHASCISQWSATCFTRLGEPTCPICRSGI